jgi:CheY-like chemotaxis protein
VLVVDDLEINRRLLREMLEGIGFEVDAVEGGVEALERMARVASPPDLVILDLRMPGMDGFELARRLRALPQGKGLKLIATSASVFSFTREDALSLGCDEFLPKPFKEHELTALLQACLGLEWETVAAPLKRLNELEGRVRNPWDLEAVRRMLEAANRGDISALRSDLAALRSGCIGERTEVEELDELAARFQMTRLRESLASLLKRLESGSGEGKGPG